MTSALAFPSASGNGVGVSADMEENDAAGSFVDAAFLVEDALLVKAGLGAGVGIDAISLLDEVPLLLTFSVDGVPLLLTFSASLTISGVVP